jgi:hypothetical protein
VAFIFSGPPQCLFWRLALLWQYLRIQLRVPGAVTFLEAQYLARCALLSPNRGLLVEVGAWKGLSTCCLSHIARHNGQDMLVFDSFQGLPHAGGPYAVAQDVDRTYRYEKGDYLGSFQEFTTNLAKYGVPSVVRTVVGDVAQISFPSEQGEKIAYAFLDVDLPDSYRAAFQMLASAIGEGTRVQLHEGLLADVMDMCRDSLFWEGLGLGVPHIRVLADQFGFRTLMTEVVFSCARRDACA